MKRTRVLSVVALALSGAIAARHAGAQPPKEGQSVEQAEQTNRQAEERATTFVKRALEAAEGRSVGQALHDKVRPLVEESFNARQGLQRAQLEALRRRLAEIEQAIQDREKNKQAIIDARTDELLSSGTALEKSTDQRLLQVDLQQAEAEYAASQEELSRVRKLHENGAVAESVLRAAEKKASDAAFQLQRLRIKLGALGDPLIVPGPISTEPASELTSDVRDGSPPPQPSPGAKYRTEYREEQVIENGGVVTRRVPVTVRIGGEPLIAPRPGAKKIPTGIAGAGEGLPDAQQQSAFGGSDLDLDSRERLVQLDLQEAIAKRDVAKNDFEGHKDANQKARGSTPKAELRKLAATLQLAEVGVKRAEVNVQGLAKRRAELESRADAAVLEASAEQQKAAAGVGIAEANREAAEAEVQKAEADLEAAEAHHKHQEKRHQRIKELVDSRAVDEKLAGESEDELGKAKAALAGARSAVATAKAHLNRTTSAIAEAQAALNVAELRLGAAQAYRDRLKQHPAADKVEAEPATEPKEDAK